MNFKALLSNLILIGFWLYINYQIYLGITTGEFNDPLNRASRNWISYDESPIYFILSMGFAVIFSLLILAIIVFITWRITDKKVKVYGGDYNLNTFKAIFRGMKK